MAHAQVIRRIGKSEGRLAELVIGQRGERGGGVTKGCNPYEAISMA